MTAINARRWLSDALMGRLDTAEISTSEADLASLLAQAESEGVCALVAASLNQRISGEDSPGMAGERARLVATFETPARELALVSMQLEFHARQVLNALQALQLPALLLKGSALAHWAYTEPQLRDCSDVDLLLASRSAAEQLALELVKTGYSRAGTSGELVAYELLCTRRITPDWALEVDVHWQLTNSPLFSRAFTFDELMADSIPLPQLAPNARGLGPVHALLHAAMHRALNLSIGLDDKLKWLYDFVVLTRGFSEADWARAVTLASEKTLAGVTLNALEATAKTFALALPADALMVLREAAQREPMDATRLADWRYMQAQTMQALPGLLPKLGLLGGLSGCVWPGGEGAHAQRNAAGGDGQRRARHSGHRGHAAPPAGR